MDYPMPSLVILVSTVLVLHADRQNYTQTRMIAILTRLPSAWVNMAVKFQSCRYS